jgi:1L-myo-inositol 1-phosphate cytidylyltransferase
MDALIIAAGYGSRLRELSDSKPLTPVAGVPLIELGVRSAMAAGVRRVVVATGHEAERLEHFLAGLAGRAGVEIVAARVDDWSKPNGFSVMAGAARISGDYLLMMSDHLFAPGILDRLAQQGAPDRGVTLAIDRRTASALIDPDDATWVQTTDTGFIRAIGKTIAAYDAVDCGAFLATPELAQAIAGAIANGKSGSLSDGMQALADAGRAATMDIGDAWWLDVDEPHYHAIAEAEAPAQLAQFSW